MKLDDRKWKEFFIGGEDGIFDISSTSSGIDKNKLFHCDAESKMPYITRSEENNGINLFISMEQNKKYNIDEKNVITIGLDTQTVFYQSYQFYTGQNIQVLRHDKLNKYTADFLIPLIKIQMQKFNWGGNGATLGRLFKTKIMLPVDKNDNIEYMYMEQYAKSITEKKLNTYKKYAQSVLEKIAYKEIEGLKDKEWKEFSIEEVAEILSGRDIYETERIVGITPYVSSTAKNNGIGYFVGNNNDTLENNCITVNRNGSVGYSFFHSYEALISNDCRKLRLKKFSKHIALFITNQITSQKEKYNYGYKMGTGRLKRQKILLPINDKKEPDYKYMEQYIINMKHKKIKQYLDYLEKNK